MRRRSKPAAGVIAITALAAVIPGCSCDPACTLRGPINDPSNRTLRRSIMSTALGEFCKQMLTHNAPLRLANDQPIIGRFYPQQCTQNELQNGDLYVQFSGFGYGWTNLSKKLTFTMSGAVQYNQDFLISDDCAVYAYFRPRNVVGSDFRINKVEQPVASFLAQVTGLADTFGRQLVTGKLGEGFTVIHDDHGDDFGLGIIDKGKRPQHPFDVHGSSRITVENARTEIHQNERDFVGPIEIQGSGRALYLTAQLEGLQAIDLLVLNKPIGDASVGYYFGYEQAGPLAGPPLVSDVVQAGAPFQHTIPLPPGMYYVLLDNTPTAGQVAPPMNPFDDRAALVNYVIQIGDAP
jgi:hypothetical protein